MVLVPPFPVLEVSELAPVVAALVAPPTLLLVLVTLPLVDVPLALEALADVETVPEVVWMPVDPVLVELVLVEFAPEPPGSDGSPHPRAIATRSQAGRASAGRSKR